MTAESDSDVAVESASADGRRATSVAELGEMMARFISVESYTAGLAFTPRPTDVVIAPYAKCGTTWLQQMAHSLRTGGDLDFDDISRVVPWIETAGDLGLDLDAPQRGEPRLYKSHLAWDDVPKGACYVVAARDPRDAVVSVYRFFEGWFFEPGSIAIEELGRVRFLESRGYYTHLASWLRHRDAPGVLLMAYEQMMSDAEGTVRRVAELMGIDPSDELVAIACDESSFASMREHADRYDDRMMRGLSERACGLPPGSDSSKVRTGTVGGHRTELSDAFLAELDAVWQETIGAEFGLANYEALLSDLAGS